MTVHILFLKSTLKSMFCALIMEHILQQVCCASLDSSVGRAEDCSMINGADILRSLVRIRLEGLFFKGSHIRNPGFPVQRGSKKKSKNLPRVRLELTTFRSLLDLFHYETDALPTALPRRTNDLLSPLFKSQSQLKKLLVE